MPETIPVVTVVGGGLAGAEAAWQLATRGVPVKLYEMRPGATTPAHRSGDFGELVCSNSFKSEHEASSAGQLKREMRTLGSVVMQVAGETRVAAGAALAVDRDAFSAQLTQRVSGHPLVEVVREELVAFPAAPAIVATGPLTSDRFESALSAVVGEDRLSFFDAAAPVIEAASIDRAVVFAASRYGKGDGADYLNAPLDRDEYEAFHAALVGARRVELRDFERRELFSACQPAEEVARSGLDALRFGAMKPVGLVDPRTGERPWAVLQLRAENRAATAYGIVGFQTNLTFGEQARVLRMVPGLERAEFVRYGVMHRNTFIDAPRLLDSTLAFLARPGVRAAGQVTGTEGYSEAAASGLVAALNTFAEINELPPVVLPGTTVLGALLAYATDPQTADYQPMHGNFGLMPPLVQRVRGKRERYAAYADRAQADLLAWRAERDDLAWEAADVG